MRFTPVRAAVLGLLVAAILPASAALAAPAQSLLILDRGHVVARRDPFLPAKLSLDPLPRARSRRARLPRARAAAVGPTVSAVLATSEQSGVITPQAHQRYLADYIAARRSFGRLSGTRRLELGAVIANLQAIAAAGWLTPSRLPALWLTLDRNRQWWTTGPLLSDGQRVGFPNSRLVWQYYAGQGIEIQWLGTFGQANGYFLAHHNVDLAALLDEAIPLAAQRAGGIAWEYLFQFDGGLPPWTSGLSQGTGIQAMSRGWSRLGNPAYKLAAGAALGVFRTPPPAGVRVATAAGAHYLEYSYAPGERILNGFIQALVGLHDYATLTGDPLGAQLFASGDAEARVEVPHYDTGAWSLYDQFSESDLSYHELLRDFLRNLCQRTQQPLTPQAPPQGPTGPTGTTGPAPLAGGAVTAAVRARQLTGGGGSDAIYCTTAARFTSYLTQPPTVSLLTSAVRGGRTALLRFTLSKISDVTLRVHSGGQTLFAAQAQLSHGAHAFAWTAPARAGTVSVTIRAVDLAGNAGSGGGSVRVLAATGSNGPRH